MRRLLSGIAAFALALGLASLARAALITFDVSDTGGSTSINALGVSTIPFAPGSLITVETDRNGNGNANDWRIVSATLNVAGDLDLSSYGLGSLTYDYSLSLGPTNGTRIGSWVIWGSNPTIPITYSGSVRCAGPICDFFQTETGAPWEPGVDYSYALYLANEVGAGNTFLNPIALGEWWLDASGTAIASAPRVDLAVQTSNPFVATQFLALVTNSYVGVEIPYEPPDPELPLPEPGVTALLLVACAGLALRRRFRVEKGFQVAALAVSGVFALAAAAHSAQVTYDLGGHGYYENVGTGIGTLSFSSSVTLELDSNGDGTLGDVTLLIGGLSSQIVNDFGALGFVRSDDAFTLTGGVGTLSGSDILWQPGGVLVNHYASTLFCSGSICDSLGLQQGVNPPQRQIPEARYGQSPPLGHWLLSTDLTQILGSTRAVFTIGGFTPPPDLDQPAEWFVFGDADLGFPVPEPGALALLLAALAALASQRAASER